MRSATRLAGPRVPDPINVLGIVAFLLPVSLLLNPLVTLTFIAMSVAVAAVIARVQRGRRNAPPAMIGATLLTGTVAIALMTYAIANATGQHPVHGNCVI